MASRRGWRRIPPSPPNPPQPPSPGKVMSHYHNFNAAGIMGPTSTSPSFQHYRPLFGSLTPPPQQQQHQPQQSLPPQTLHPQQQQQQQEMYQKTLQSLGFSDGSPSPQPTRFGIEQNQSQNQQQQQLQKKRGRPRKYTPDDNVALGLAQTSSLLSAAGGGDGGVGDSGGGGGGNDSADPPAKRKGRPPGSGKKQALGLNAGVRFTAQVIEVKIGEDIASKIIAFSDHGPRSICVLSASGEVSKVTLKQPSHSGGTVTYEGQYSIITLSGSFMNYEVNGSTNRRGSLSVALAGFDGQVVGGDVVGPLVAATQVQVIVGSFGTAKAKKPKQSSGNNSQGQNTESASAAADMSNFGSISQGPKSESSEGNEGSSPMMQRDSNSESYGAQQQQDQQPLWRPYLGR